MRTLRAARAAAGLIGCAVGWHARPVQVIDDGVLEHVAAVSRGTGGAVTDLDRFADAFGFRVIACHAACPRCGTATR